MGDKVAGSPPEGTPPEDFDSFDPAVVVKHLLGPPPLPSDAPARRMFEFRAFHPEQWPRDKTDLEYFHRALVRLLSERGGTAEATASILRDLDDGRIPAFVIDDKSGKKCLIPPDLWKAADTSALMYWTGKASFYAPGVGRIEGDIFLTTAPETVTPPEPTETPAYWWPKPAQSQVSWATDPQVEREAERRLKAAGVAVTEAATGREMEAMARKAGRSWAAASITAARRRRR
jgi:hypothetical protein